MPQYEIIDTEELRMVKVTLDGDTVRAESGALHYMIGNIEMVTKKPSMGGCLLYTSPSPRDLSTSRMPSSA